MSAGQKECFPTTVGSIQFSPLSSTASRSSWLRRSGPRVSWTTWTQILNSKGKRLTLNWHQATAHDTIYLFSPSVTQRHSGIMSLYFKSQWTLLMTLNINVLSDMSSYLSYWCFMCLHLNINVLKIPIKIELAYDLAIPLLGIYPEKNIVWKDTCTPALFTSQDTEAN